MAPVDPSDSTTRVANTFTLNATLTLKEALDSGWLVATGLIDEADRPPVRMFLPEDSTYENLAAEAVPALVRGQELILRYYQRKLAKFDDDNDGVEASRARRAQQEQEVRICQAKNLRDVELPARKAKEARTLGKLAWVPRLYKPEDADFIIDVCVVEVDLDNLHGQVPENVINCAGHEVLLYAAMNPRRGKSAYFELTAQLSTCSSGRNQ